VYDTIVSSAGQSLSGQAEKRTRRVPIEPFPIFIVPQAYPGRLLTVVGEWLRTVVREKGDVAGGVGRVGGVDDDGAGLDLVDGDPRGGAGTTAFPLLCYNECKVEGIENEA
jgi:hypothetical protein